MKMYDEDSYGGSLQASCQDFSPTNWSSHSGEPPATFVRLSARETIQPELRIRTFSQTWSLHSEGKRKSRPQHKSAVQKATQIEHSNNNNKLNTCTQVYTGYYVSNQSTALKIFILYLNQRESFHGKEKKNLLQKLVCLFFFFLSCLFLLYFKKILNGHRYLTR